MALTPGTRLGPYEINALIGKGGMGEVYRATDTKLKRQVALKILPTALAANPDRIARFQREAEVLASLNHPNIAQIHGLEDDHESQVLVMEFVDGPTLADRLALGAIPVDEALLLAKHIAEALEAAHALGIVHRDLKPANIKGRADGTVKVLDFGLAKAMEPVTVGSEDASELRTITTPAMTQAGVIFGTAAYMSPEQARGRPVDKRTDIWAFGCVLYELLTGRRAFDFDDVSETLAGVLRADPDWSVLPADLSPSIRAFLIRCFQKDPRQRVHDIADMRLALEGAFDTGTSQTGVVTAAARPAWRLALLIAAAVSVTAGVTGLSVWSLARPVAAPIVARMQMPWPAGQPLYFSGRHVVAISPSGSHVAFTAGLGLWLRPLDQLEARLVPGTELEARSPFFSPDGQWIGYYAAGELRRVSVTGGAPVTLTKIVNPWGASWGADDVILYGQGPQGIWRVPAEGGAAERVLAVKDGEIAHGPQMLSGGEWILFTLLPAGVGSWNRAQIVMQSLRTGERVQLVDGGRDARYLPTGHLVYGLSGALLAVPFDLGTRRVTGGAVLVVRDVFDASGITGAVHFDVAASGSLVYLPRSEAALRLVWVDRNGRDEVVPGEPRPYRHPRVSPNGTRIAVEVEDPNDTDVWIGDSRRGTFSRLTLGDDVDSDPIWSPDGSRVVFSSVSGAAGLFWQAIDGSGMAERLTDGSGGMRANTWTSSGELIYEEPAGADVRVLSPDGRSPAHLIPLFDMPEYFNERLPAVSPDGRWLAYQSTESGQMEVYVRPFPNVKSGRTQVSSGGGFAPLWSRDGREIFYRNASSLMAATVLTEPTFSVPERHTLFSLSGFVLAGNRGIRYNVAPDGRFLLLKGETPGDSASQQRIIVIQNWFSELRRLVPTK